MTVSLQEKLIGLGAERLAVLLVEHASDDKILNKKLKLALLALSPEKLANTLRIRLSLLKKSERFIDWQQAANCAKELQLLCDSIENDLLPQSPLLAAELTETFLAIAPNILARVDDSYGNVSDIFSQLVSLWGKSYFSINYDPEILVNKLLSLILTDDYGVYSHLIEAFAPALQRKGLSYLETQAIASLSSNHQLCFRMRLKCILHVLADVKHSPDDYIKTFQMTGCPINDEDRLNIAKRLNGAYRGQESLEWLSGIKKTTYLFSQYIDLKIEAYDLEGDIKQAQALRWQTFTQTLAMDYYLAYLKASPLEQKDNIQQKALSVVHAHTDVLQSLRWLLDIDYLAEAAIHLRGHIDHICGNGYFIIRPIAKQFAEGSYFLEAIILYRRLCESVLASARSKHYPYAAKDLKQAMELSLQVNDWDEVDTSAHYLQKLKRQHGRKYGFWQTYQAL